MPKIIANTSGNVVSRWTYHSDGRRGLSERHFDFENFGNLETRGVGHTLPRTVQGRDGDYLSLTLPYEWLCTIMVAWKHTKTFARHEFLFVWLLDVILVTNYKPFGMIIVHRTAVLIKFPE